MAISFSKNSFISPTFISLLTNHFPPLKSQVKTMEKKLIFTAIFSLLFLLSHARNPSNLIADEHKSLQSLDTIPTSVEYMEAIPLPKDFETPSTTTIAIDDLQSSNTDENTIRAIGIIHFHPINRHFRHHMMHMKHNCHHHQHGEHMIRNPREVSYGNDMILSDGKGSQPFDRSQFFAKPFDQVRDEKKGGVLKKVSKFLDDLF